MNGGNGYAGTRSWHLPKLEKLKTVIDKNYSNPTVDNKFFPKTIPKDYWSDTTGGGGLDYGFTVWFRKGNVYKSLYSGRQYVRCVSNEYMDKTKVGSNRTKSKNLVNFEGPIVMKGYEDDYITKDHYMRLLWRTCSEGLNGKSCKKGKALKLNYEKARSRCFSLNNYNKGNGYAGRKRWRLPKLKTLKTVIDKRFSNPVVDVKKFPNTIPRDYWSDTTGGGGLNYGFTVWFNKGNIYKSGHFGKQYVRCVTDDFE